MTTPDPREQPEPQAPGYGDQGPAGGGRDQDENDKAAEPHKESRGPEAR